MEWHRDSVGRRGTKGHEETSGVIVVSVILVVAMVHRVTGVTRFYSSDTCGLFCVGSASVKKYVKSKHFAEQKNTKNTFSKW